MARYGEILTVERDIEDGAHVVNIKVDPGGSANVPAEFVQAPGSDCLPLPGDFAALTPIEGSGREQVQGTSDPVNEGVAKPGEVRHYARKPDGTPAAHIYAKQDGSIVVECLIPGATITVHSTGTLNLVSDTDDIRLGQGGQKIATVGSIVSGSVIVPSLGVPTPFAAQVISGLPGASGG